MDPEACSRGSVCGGFPNCGNHSFHGVHASRDVVIMVGVPVA